MANNYFAFKQFKILQEKSAMKVGTDGVLLGALADVSHAKTILDIGTGTGLIALMLAQRSRAAIDAIEIDEDAFEEACQNVATSPWPGRIRLFYLSLQEFSRKPGKGYDLIVSNPPFFSNSLTSENLQKNLARHNTSLTPTQLIEGAHHLLASSGIFQLILPAENTQLFIELGAGCHLFCQNKIWIKPTPEKAPKRVVLTFGRNKVTCIEKTLVIESGGRHVYSPTYRELTKDFYLNF
ncbi:MAG: methyltransferase [Salinivirgaceae bacterium]|nr:methyltransferase [Salinivirgaceae bacterium]